MFLVAQHWCRGLRLEKPTTKHDKSTKKTYLSATNTYIKLAKNTELGDTTDDLNHSVTNVKTRKGEHIKLNILVYSIKVASSCVFKLNFFYSNLVLKTYIFFFTQLKSFII